MHVRQNAERAIDAVHEMELPQLISVNAVNDLESRMQNEIAVIELDQPQLNWTSRNWTGSTACELEVPALIWKLPLLAWKICIII